MAARYSLGRREHRSGQIERQHRVKQWEQPMTPAGDVSGKQIEKPARVDVEAGKARAGLRSAPPIDARRIDHVQISVRDLDESAGFYAALLGVELKEQGNQGERWCILGAPDRFYLCLVEVPSAGDFKLEDVHINHVGFVVDDIDETVRRIRELGLRLGFNDTIVDWPRSRSAYVLDPNGIWIEITNRFGGGLG
jgi:catechol 2,3-dioxygenase-like lactoylglutathione lyase family enzyme